MNQYHADQLTTRRDQLYNQGYNACPEVEDYVQANLNDFIGVSLDTLTFTYKLAARRINDQFGTTLEDGDVQLSILIFVEWGWFEWTGMDGNTKLYTPVKEMWV